MAELINIYPQLNQKAIRAVLISLDTGNVFFWLITKSGLLNDIH